MKKEEVIELSLHFDIDKLIKMQKLLMSEMKKDNQNVMMICYQEDILQILEKVKTIESVTLNPNNIC